MATETFAELNSRLEAPGIGRPFLACLEAREVRGRLTVHAARSSMSRRQATSLRSALASEFDLNVRVRRHATWTLKRARSLQGFLRPFARGRIVFDPTGIFTRSTHLVDFATRCRAGMAGAIRSLLWHSASGSLFVVLNEQRMNDPGRGEVGIAAMEHRLRGELAALHAGGANGFIRHVRVGFHEPRLPTTPVDDRSASRQLGVLLGFGKRAALTSLAAGLGFGVAAARAEDAQQAVSGLNGEIGIMAGQYEGSAAFLVEGALTVPLADQVGARWDVLAGTIYGATVGGTAGHLFWRDPEFALLGVAGGMLVSSAPLVGSARQVAVVAVEAEAYFDELTVSGTAGFQMADVPGNDGPLGRLDLEWYPNEDLMVSGGVETNPQVGLLGRLGVEYRPAFEALPGLSVFAEGAVGTQGYHRVLGGIRFYFGESETLRDRHRRDTFRTHLLPTRMIDSLPSSRLAYGN